MIWFASLVVTSLRNIPYSREQQTWLLSNLDPFEFLKKTDKLGHVAGATNRDTTVCDFTIDGYMLSIIPAQILGCKSE